MAYHADPGGIFESDTHRRVLAHLPQPDDPPIAVYNPDVARPSRVSLFHRMIPDAGTDLADQEELESVLADLEASGYAAQADEGWRQTQAGLDALNAPVPGEEA